MELGAAAGVVGGIGAFASGRQAQTYRFGGRVEAWIGQEPAAIADEENPTLELTAGQEYEVVWENLDGQPHDFTVQDEEGNVLAQTERTSEEGATRSLTFTATEEMTTYVCTVHPTTMVGDVEVAGEATATPGEGTPAETPAGTPAGTPTQFAGFFEEGVEVGVEQVAGGPLTAPTDFADAADDSGRYFVTDQTGQVYAVTDEGVQGDPLVDVSDRMVELGNFYGLYASQFQDYDERGLIGIATHPDFGENGRLFLHYSAPPTEELRSINWDHIEVVSEFAMSDDGESIDPESEVEYLRIPSPQYNHDSGPMTFGPDGYLYVPMGDGGGANDDMYGHVPDWYDRNTGGNGQDVRHNLLGDVLRIDVDDGADATDAGTATPGGTPTDTPAGTPEGTETPAEGTPTPTPTGDTIQIERPYGIPEDNPFVGDSDALDEIFAYGFRNPFGIDFDSEGNLFVADAGQNLWEEVDVVVNGGNYGWNVKEGTHCFSTENPGDVDAIADCPGTEPDEDPYDGSPLIDPIAEYPHVYRGESVGIVVVGGHRYENETIPDLQGKYVFGDWSADPAREEPRGRVFTATPPEDWDGLQVETPAETGTATTGTPGETGTAAAESATVQVLDQQEYGRILVGPDGQTLYMFDQDEQGAGASACTDECADAWPPLTVEGEVSAGEGVTAELTTFEREDGSTQVAANGWPLYYYADDDERGDVNGQGVNDVWWVLDPSGTPRREATPTGTPAETETPDAVETAPEKATPGEEQEGTPPGTIGPDEVPRGELWEMAELQFTGEFNWFVRQFGQDEDGEIYVLVSKRGIPAGETGAVLRIVPPGEGDTPTDGGTPAEETPTETES